MENEYDFVKRILGAALKYRLEHVSANDDVMANYYCCKDIEDAICVVQKWQDAQFATPEVRMITEEELKKYKDKLQEAMYFVSSAKERNEICEMLEHPQTETGQCFCEKEKGK